MDEPSKPRSRFQWRAFVSVLTAWSFTIAAVTGLVLYVVPQGRIAYWVDWRLLALTKTDWGNIHVVAVWVFVVFGALHLLLYNLRPFIKYLKGRVAGGPPLRPEFLAATAAAALVVVSAIWRLPPLSLLVDLSEHVKATWIEGPDDEPPFGHAELLSLAALCRKTGIDRERALAALERAGIEVSSPRETLESIARDNRISPRDLFAEIRHLAPRSTPKGKPGAEE